VPTNLLPFPDDCCSEGWVEQVLTRLPTARPVMLIWRAEVRTGRYPRAVWNVLLSWRQEFICLHRRNASYRILLFDLKFRIYIGTIMIAGLTTLLPWCADFLKILGASTSWNPRGLSRPVQGQVLAFTIMSERSDNSLKLKHTNLILLNSYADCPFFFRW
jgi:hypothetical protein